MAIITKKKNQIIKKGKSKNMVPSMKNSKDGKKVGEKKKDKYNICSNPFLQKEDIKPFDVSNMEYDDTESEIEEEKKLQQQKIQQDKASFNLLLKKRIKQMNKQTENIQDKEDDRYTFQDEIADFGKSWYEEKLVNDIPRKLTIF
ncbi:conserved Plasmodium protein, unknown function [Plasmodium reichenowi]|uniref:Uncharacterized protein n=1 Tax=Plasmodium reichenowi TaxID=5854 RepID=A0A060RZL3_PLARE|nr:hypothetical protein PRSY57_1446400 [Plasmodium reichenowi]KYN94124.1 hypothetical protein PRSY57_1446400 [Plasmodium reichenowi]CDO66935.1 conserved Plasmodium protein, unknown function [Plasmodium reichenowi]